MNANPNSPRRSGDAWPTHKAKARRQRAQRVRQGREPNQPADTGQQREER